MFFCCEHKTAYEVRISDCSSDVCSSDLEAARHGSGDHGQDGHGLGSDDGVSRRPLGGGAGDRGAADLPAHLPPGNYAVDRKSVGEGKSMAVRVALGGPRINKKKTIMRRERYVYTIY